MRTLQQLAPDGARSQRDAARQDGYAENKWQLLKVIEEIREPLGLKGTTISLLRAMLSFVRSDEITATQDADHICFASNAALARRTHVSVQTVERHIAKLVEIGLLTRKASPNGKRWARRDRDGQILLATGLSLMPLVRRYAEFMQIAREHAQKQQELTLLRDACTRALAELGRMASGHPKLEALQAQARRLLRRKPDDAALRAFLVDITAELPTAEARTPVELRGSDPETEGHKETSSTQSVERTDFTLIEVSPDQMEHAFPRLCAELRLCRTSQDCHRHMDDIAQHLQLGTLWPEINALGPALRFMILGYLLERVETIQRPRSYASVLLGRLRGGGLQWETLLRKPRRTGLGMSSVQHRTRYGSLSSDVASAKGTACTPPWPGTTRSPA